MGGFPQGEMQSGGTVRSGRKNHAAPVVARSGRDLDAKRLETGRPRVQNNLIATATNPP
jgi:hypothetical protein